MMRRLGPELTTCPATRRVINFSSIAASQVRYWYTICAQYRLGQFLQRKIPEGEIRAEKNKSCANDNVLNMLLHWRPGAEGMHGRGCDQRSLESINFTSPNDRAVSSWCWKRLTFRSTLPKIEMSEASTPMAKFGRSVLKYGRFVGADLFGADFSHADCEQCDFSKADLGARSL